MRAAAQFVAGSKRIISTHAATTALIGAFSSDEAKAELRALFDDIDRDGNGRVSAAEWGRAVSSQRERLARFFGGVTIEEVGRAFARLDADGSGDLTFEEFEEGVASMDVASRLTQALAIEEGQQELRGLFEALDKDEDGTVSGKEWGAAVSKNVELMAKYFGGLTVPQVAKAFARLDKDGSRDLTWTEFQQGSKRIVTFAPPQA